MSQPSTTVTHLISYPGVGKYTIGSHLCELTGARFIHNHLVNNVIYNVLGKNRVSPTPPEVWAHIDTIWGCVMDTMVNIAPPELSFVITNVLYEDKPADRSWIEEVAENAIKRGSIYVPVILRCDDVEHEKRLTSAGRAEMHKEVRLEKLRKARQEYQVVKADLPYRFELDVSNLTALESAQRIQAHLNGLCR